MEQFEQFRQLVENVIAISATETDKVKQAYMIYTRIQEIIEEMQVYIRRQPFSDKQSEVQYYKHEAPWFYGKSLYYLKISKLQIEKSKPSRELLLGYISNELSLMDSFYQQNHELLGYLLTNDTSRDTVLFTRHPKGSAPLTELALITSDVLTPASFQTATLTMYREYGPVLRQEKANAEGGTVPVSSLLDGKKIEFDATEAAVAEVIEGWYLKKVVKVDGRDANINELAEIWKTYFNKPLENIYRIILHNNRRKKERTPFMNSMIELINQKNAAAKK